jgi:hypothetical protein
LKVTERLTYAIDGLLLMLKEADIPGQIGEAVNRLEEEAIKANIKVLIALGKFLLGVDVSRYYDI